jgi:hypothetical protein
MSFAPDRVAALVVAVCFAAGLNVYATIATLGLLARGHVVELPVALSLVTSWWVIGACAALYALEFVADKIPVFDLAWNALQTVVRIPVAALFAFGAASNLSFAEQLVAAAAGGLIALAAHGGKIAARVAVTPSPEPVSNAVLSVLEDVVAVGITSVATRYPYWAAGIALVLLGVGLVGVSLVVRVVRSLFGTDGPTRQ